VDNRYDHRTFGTPRQIQRRRRYGKIAAIIVVLTLLTGIGLYYGLDLARQRAIFQSTLTGTPERTALQRAVERYRDFPEEQARIQYVYPVTDGVLVFYQRFIRDQAIDISFEYMRRTWQGWKWVHGGGMGGSYTEKHPQLFYEYFASPDEYLHMKTPFPVVVGALYGNQERLRIEGDNGYAVDAVVFPSAGQHGWFAFLPESAGEKFELKAMDSNGRIVATDSLDIQEKNRQTSGFSSGTATSE